MYMYIHVHIHVRTVDVKHRLDYITAVQFEWSGGAFCYPS